MPFDWSQVSGSQGPTFDGDLGVKNGGIALTADGSLDEWVDQSSFALDAQIVATPSVITWSKTGLNGHGVVHFNPGGSTTDPLHTNNLHTVDNTNAGVGHLGDPTSRTKFTWYLVVRPETFNIDREELITGLRATPAITLYQLGTGFNFANLFIVTEPSLEVAFTDSFVAPFGLNYIFPFQHQTAWNLITLIYDGTATNADLDAQDRLRMRFFLNNVQFDPSYVFTLPPNGKHCPANTGDASTSTTTNYQLGTTRGGHLAYQGGMAFSRIQYDTAHTTAERTMVWDYLRDRYLLGPAPTRPSRCRAELAGVV